MCKYHKEGAWYDDVTTEQEFHEGIGKMRDLRQLIRDQRPHGCIDLGKCYSAYLASLQRYHAHYHLSDTRTVIDMVRTDEPTGASRTQACA